MNIHEYQAKEVLKEYGIPMPPFFVARNGVEVQEGLKLLKMHQGVVKIQVHAGGRGKAGGVKIGKTEQEILDYAALLIGMKMVNNQTGKEGVVSSSVLISEPVSIAHEYYLSILIDRQLACPLLIASPAGGMEIEEVAAKTPEKILKLKIPTSGMLRSYQLLQLAKFMGWEGKEREEGTKIAQGITKAFFDLDASLIEINPLVKDDQGNILALDAKISIDDNALYRQPKMRSFYDPSQLSSNERLAQEFELAYIALEGNIGCMVNGAGLAMATMDLIQHYGGMPANFLDVGGGASKEKVTAGFKIILSDPNVKAILVNIFGGIMDCAVLAEGIIAAVKELGMRVPLIVRMEGTHVEEGKKKLKDSNLPIHSVDNLEDAAKQAVLALKRGHGDFSK